MVSQTVQHKSDAPIQAQVERNNRTSNLFDQSMIETAKEFVKIRLNTIYYYLLLNRTEYSMKINELRSQLVRANVRNNVVQFVAR